MIKIEPNKLIIEIPSVSPVEDLLNLQQSLYQIILERTICEIEGEPSLKHWYNLVDFLGELLFINMTNPDLYDFLIQAFRNKSFPDKIKPSEVA